MRIKNSSINTINESSLETTPPSSQKEVLTVDNSAEGIRQETGAETGTNTRKAMKQAESGIGVGLMASQIRAKAKQSRPSATYLGRSSRAEVDSISSTAKRSTATTGNQKASPLTLADYRQEAEAIIKGAGTNREARNAAITGAYADMFEQNPLAFKWAGMAAHASFIVGMGIKTGTIGQLASPFIGSQLRNMLVTGNNAVFADVYPVYLAYQRGGMAEVNRIAGSLPAGEFEGFRPLRDAFAKIDEGQKLYKGGQQKKGMDLIWEGNRDLLRHEQLELLQSAVYDKYSFVATMISPFMMADFDDTYGIDKSTFSAYWSNHSFRSIANPTERMKWLEGELMPIWRRQNEQQPNLVLKHMETFRRLGREAGARY